eukprot:gene22759-biopygen14809
MPPPFGATHGASAGLARRRLLEQQPQVQLALPHGQCACSSRFFRPPPPYLGDAWPRAVGILLLRNCTVRAGKELTDALGPLPGPAKGSCTDFYNFLAELFVPGRRTAGDWGKIAPQTPGNGGNYGT